ncbi:MAG: hypothetical protein KKD90_03730 [Candidatus Omnitrophica bacterium]|nr:hypothetical protein [Candidatus Omnitrophota bacterium]
MNKLNKGLAVVLGLFLIMIILEVSLSLAGVIFLRLKNISQPVKKEAGDLAILCLGDSFTHGFGAPQGKSYPEQLQELVKGQTNKNITVYKEFRINSSTILKHLESDIDNYRPDLIIIMTGCNDTWSLENLDFFTFRELDCIKKMDIWLSNSKVYKLIKIGFLNARGAIVKENLYFIQEDDMNKFYFKSPEAQRHYDSGENYFYEGESEMALAEFKEAVDLEPRNPWVHWRLACIYNYALHEYNLAKDEAMLVFMYGDSSMIGKAFIALRDSIMLDGQNNDEGFYTAIKEMGSIIENTYESEDKDKAKRYLRQLLSYCRNDNEIKRVVYYNLNEILRITQQSRIKLVLMQYPMRLAGGVEDSIKSLSDKYSIPLVDNCAIFEDRLGRFKKEDLFVRDGHCNANGYKLIAENLYKVLIEERMFDDLGNKRPSN